MDKYSTLWYKLYGKITNIISNIHWQGLRALFNGGIYYDLKPEELDELRMKLAKSYYIILINRKCHLTTWLIGLMSLIKFGKWPAYSHALMNCDLEDDPEKWWNFKLIEATGVGVHYSKFMEVFDSDSVCLLQPKNMTKEKWNDIIDALLKQNGYKYDDLFDLSDRTRVSCVELVLNALQASPTYADDFCDLKSVIEKKGNLIPQMYRDCSDLEVVMEIRH